MAGYHQANDHANQLDAKKAAQEASTNSGNFRAEEVQDVDFVESDRPASVCPENW